MVVTVTNLLFYAWRVTIILCSILLRSSILQTYVKSIHGHDSLYKKNYRKYKEIYSNRSSKIGQRLEGKIQEGGMDLKRIDGNYQG